MKTEFQWNKKYVHDVILFLIASDKIHPQHISAIEGLILQKLIHYSTKNEKITYSNKVIAEHTFQSESHIKKLVSRLIKTKLITSVIFKISDGKSIIIRRTININWNLIESIFRTIPIKKEPIEEIEIVQPEEPEQPITTVSDKRRAVDILNEFF